MQLGRIDVHPFKRTSKNIPIFESKDAFENKPILSIILHFTQILRKLSMSCPIYHEPSPSSIYVLCHR